MIITFYIMYKNQFFLNLLKQKIVFALIIMIKLSKNNLYTLYYNN